LALRYHVAGLFSRKSILPVAKKLWIHVHSSSTHLVLVVELHRLELVSLLVVDWSLRVSHLFNSTLLLVTHLTVVRVEETLIHALAAPVVRRVGSSDDWLFRELLICNLLNESFIWGILVQVQLVFKHHVHFLFEFVNSILGLVYASAYFHRIVFSHIFLLMVPNTRLAS
jgi:hypothetical protein